MNHQAEVRTMYDLLMRAKSRRLRRLSYDEACDFIAAATGRTIEHVRKELNTSGEPTKGGHDLQT